MGIHRISARYIINTPCFVSSADQLKAELSANSFKGVLRFWWRALQYSQLSGSVEKLKRKEDEIFGSAANAASGGRSSFKLSLRLDRSSNAPEKWSLGNRKGLGYAGYGPAQSNREYYGAETVFWVGLVANQPIDATVVDALKLIGLVGGIGARSRRGWGSLSLTELKDAGESIYLKAEDKTDYGEALLAALAPCFRYVALPSISAFYKHTKIYQLDKGSVGLDLVNSFGFAMMRYRSFGFKKNSKATHKILAADGEMINAEQNFADDHIWQAGGSLSSPINYPQRIAFGLPQPYGKNGGVGAEGFDRRGSPLFHHIHRQNDGCFVSVALVLKSVFLPPGTKIENRSGKAPPTPLLPPIDDYWCIIDFLNNQVRGVRVDDSYFPKVSVIR